MFKMKGVLLLIGILSVSLPSQGMALDGIEIYLAGYGMATQPLPQGLSWKGRDVAGARIHGDPGGGVKIGLFPSFFHGYLGVELESFGHHNFLSFPALEDDKGAMGQSNLVTYASMVNLLLRYPGQYVRPYVGIGGGVSNGILFNTDIPGRNDKSVEMRSVPAYQFLGGVQLLVTNKWFVFGEYKYSSANYRWRQLSLNFRSEYFLGGFGYIF